MILTIFEKSRKSGARDARTSRTGRARDQLRETIILNNFGKDSSRISTGAKSYGQKMNAHHIGAFPIEIQLKIGELPPLLSLVGGSTRDHNPKFHAPTMGNFIPLRWK